VVNATVIRFDLVQAQRGGGSFFFSRSTPPSYTPTSPPHQHHASIIRDPYGRNVYGTPPQGRADYAFFQHIVLSMKPDTGRCAILSRRRLAGDGRDHGAGVSGRD
jgi:hypothetical protein